MRSRSVEPLTSSITRCRRRDRRRCGRLHCRRRAAARSDADGTDPLRHLVTARARTCAAVVGAPGEVVAKKSKKMNYAFLILFQFAIARYHDFSVRVSLYLRTYEVHLRRSFPLFKKKRYLHFRCTFLLAHGPCTCTPTGTGTGGASRAPLSPATEHITSQLE